MLSVFCGRTTCTPSFGSAAQKSTSTTWDYTLSFLLDSATQPVTTLVDQRTGRRTTVTGQPAVPPDGQYLLRTRSGQGNDGSSEAHWLGPRTTLLKQEYEAADQEADTPPETCGPVELPR